MGMVEWHGSTGILSPTQQHVSGRFDVAASKGVLIRGICGAYSCNQSEVEFQNKARAYINVQFNAPRDFACQEDSYGIEWGGPSQGCTTVSQMTALDVLVAGITANP
ncbi:hypothetical protein FRC03_003630 [Tulasnella sp. 419]|nr:hypothetical protein FRC03_003630 [Tulasnella sp. 419]